MALKFLRALTQQIRSEWCADGDVDEGGWLVVVADGSGWVDFFCSRARVKCTHFSILQPLAATIKILASSRHFTIFIITISQFLLFLLFGTLRLV